MITGNKRLKDSCFNNVQIPSQLIFYTRQVFGAADSVSPITIKQELLEEVTEKKINDNFYYKIHKLTFCCVRLERIPERCYLDVCGAELLFNNP